MLKENDSLLGNKNPFPYEKFVGVNYLFCGRLSFIFANSGHCNVEKRKDEREKNKYIYI